MPVIDGYEATKRIRSMELAQGRNPTPIIATTANTGDEQKCLDAGMNDFIPKPYRLRDLKTKIDRWNIK